MNRRITATLVLVFALTGCAIFSSNKSDISSFDRDYLENKYVGKIGWAKTDLGGIKTGEQLTVSAIDFDVRTFVRVKSGSTDHFFIAYNNKDMVPNEDQKVRVSYDIATIEREINDRISFLKPGN
ncbi:MAG TPA: hypothetical protein PK297_05685 [Spirochaetota bacterium]|nr:hypothetical protein [Spirochaetota bacterium]